MRSFRLPPIRRRPSPGSAISFRYCSASRWSSPALCSVAGAAKQRHIKLSLYPISKDSLSLMRSSYLFTSESVSEGHPDKVAGQISDAIVDLFLSKDPEARIACETLTTTQLVVLAGEIRCRGVYEDGEWAPGAQEEIEATVRATVKRIGYEQTGFHWKSFTFQNKLHGQSEHIAQGV